MPHEGDALPADNGGWRVEVDSRAQHLWERPQADEGLGAMEDPGLTPRPDEATPEEDEDAGAAAPEPETIPEEPEVTDPDEQGQTRDP